MRSVFLFQDLKLPGRDYHTSLGAVRTKPGRGDPTRSLSCSDKLLKWRALGLQVMMRESFVKYRTVQLNFTTEMDVFYMLFISLTAFIILPFPV